MNKQSNAVKGSKQANRGYENEETESKKKGCMSDEAKKRNRITVNVLACKKKGTFTMTSK